MHALERAAALLAASKAAVELGRVGDAERLLDRAEAAATPDRVLALELVTHRADIGLSLGGETAGADAEAVAHEAGRRADELVAASDGLEALDRRSLRAYERAKGVQTHAAWLQHDFRGRAAADEAHLAAAR